MSEEYQQFLDFDWSDPRWLSYLNGLYPPPNQKQVLKFKKKWYKKAIDPNFDDSYEPPSATPAPSRSSGTSFSAGGGASGSGGSKSSTGLSAFSSGLYADGSRWAIMGPKAAICFVAYAVSLTTAVGGFANAFPAYQALIVLVGAFILEILAKYGLKFNSNYLHSVLLDDVGVMPIMAVTLLTPGLHPFIRMFALVPPFSTALLSFAQICKAHKRLPMAVQDFFSPLAGVKARYQVMRARAHAEVALGFLLVIGVFTVRAAPISALLFWNFMIMRYITSSWTQASFKAIDGALSPVLTKIPLVSGGYASIKRGLYSFVDPEKRRSGRSCAIL